MIGPGNAEFTLIIDDTSEYESKDIKNYIVESLTKCFGFVNSRAIENDLFHLENLNRVQIDLIQKIIFTY